MLHLCDSCCVLASAFYSELGVKMTGVLLFLLFFMRVHEEPCVKGRDGWMDGKVKGWAWLGLGCLDKGMCCSDCMTG